MKKILLLLFILFCTKFYAQQADPMKAWQDFMTPSAAHKQLAKEVGFWEADVLQWMDPSQPPTKVKAKNVVTMAMNGLYQIGNFTSTMMGMPMKGQSTVGYDNAKKEYVSTWIDNLGSGIILMKGKFDEQTNTLHLKGVQTDPMTGTDMEIREEIIWSNDNEYTLKMFGAGQDGKEMKFMEGTFKRVPIKKPLPRKK